MTADPKALARAVHTVRTPLTVIKAETQLAVRQRQMSHELGELLLAQVERAQVALDELVPRRDNDLVTAAASG